MASRRRQRQWTVLVYMAAQDSLRLDALAVQDLREMERVGSNDNVNVIVQINRAWPQIPQRYQVLRTKSKQIENDDLNTNMGEGKTLRAFLTWAARDNRCRAKHYLLVLWGHAYGLGFGRDHDDPVTLEELQAALDAFKRRRPKPRRGRRPRLELLGANACAMSYAEAAYQLRNSAQYFVASEIAVPFAGWPYESILRAINSKTEPKDLGKIVVDSYVDHFTTSESDKHVSMTLLDLDHVDGLRDGVSKLADLLRKTIFPKDVAGYNRLMHVRDVFRATAAGGVRPLIDFRDLCQGLQDLFEDLRTLEARRTKSQQNAAEKLANFLKPADQAEGLTVNSTVNGADAFVVYHKRNPKLQELNGVGIFAPFVTDHEDLKRLGLLDPVGSQDGQRRSTGWNAHQRRNGVQTASSGERHSMGGACLRRTAPGNRA